MLNFEWYRKLYVEHYTVNMLEKYNTGLFHRIIR